MPQKADLGCILRGNGGGVPARGIQECFPTAGKLSAETPPNRGGGDFQRCSGCSRSKVRSFAEGEPPSNLSDGKK